MTIYEWLRRLNLEKHADGFRKKGIRYAKNLNILEDDFAGVEVHDIRS